MDPVSAALITGLAVGVSEGLTEAGKALLSDTYAALKAVLQKKFGVNNDLIGSIDHLEKKPSAETRQADVEAEVKAFDADKDADVLAAAKALLEAVRTIPQGEATLAKYNIKADNIGIVGGTVHIEGGLHIS